MLGIPALFTGNTSIVGLADTLRSELLLYGIDVHIFFPPKMYTAGYQEENKTKPKITLEIESTDEGITAEKAAMGLFKGSRLLLSKTKLSISCSFISSVGIERGDAHITADLITDLFRSSTRGVTPVNNWLLDGLYDAIAYVCPLIELDVTSIFTQLFRLPHPSGVRLLIKSWSRTGKDTTHIWNRMASLLDYMFVYSF